MPIESAGELPLEEIALVFQAHKKTPLIFMVEPEFRSSKTAAPDLKKPYRGDLFPQSSNLFDVNQGLVGNCHVMSTIATILSKQGGDKIIAGCMKDLTGLGQITGEGNRFDNKIMVRFFSEFTPFPAVAYAIVDKSMLITKHRAHGPFYIHVLEKALAGLYRNKNLNSLSSGGATSEVMNALTSGVADSYGLSFFSKQRFYKEMWGDNFRLKRFLDLVFKDQEVKIAFLTHRSEFKKFWPKVNLSMDLKEQKVLEKFKQAVMASDYYVKHQNDIDEIISALTNTHEFFVTTGKYSENYIKHLTLIRMAIEKKLPVTISTKKNIGPSEGRGFSAGEVKSQGMVAGHAYAVVDYKENVKVGEQLLKGVQVYNPWGNRREHAYGVQYKISGGRLQRESSHNALFWLEAKDLHEVGNDLVIGEIPIEPELTLQLSKKAQGILKNENKGNFVREGIVAEGYTYSRQEFDLQMKKKEEQARMETYSNPIWSLWGSVSQTVSQTFFSSKSKGTEQPKVISPVSRKGKEAEQKEETPKGKTPKSSRG